MKRGAGTGGKDEHVQLVKLASKKIIDTFQNLRYILVSYEKQELKLQITVRDGMYGETNAHFELRPDIVLRAENIGKDGRSPFRTGIERIVDDEDKNWKSIMDSHAIVFEAETDPRNLFSNVLKLDAYRKLRAYGRAQYAFVLVCWDDAKLPENVEPFDEVWKFPKEA